LNLVFGYILNWFKAAFT